MLPDRQARDGLVGAIRSLVAGTITSDEFDSRVPAQSSDPAIRALMSNGAWKLYAGSDEAHLADRDRGIVARWSLFLKTDNSYEWPTPTRRQRVALALLAVLTFGLSKKLVRRSFTRAGDLGVWPFLRRTDYGAAMKSPAYL